MQVVPSSLLLWPGDADADGADEGALPTTRLLLVLSGLYLWLLFFSLPPHKEERFMFPIYPLLCFAAAISISALARGLSRLLGAPSARAPRSSSKRTTSTCPFSAAM